MPRKVYRQLLLFLILWNCSMLWRIWGYVCCVFSPSIFCNVMSVRLSLLKVARWETCFLFVLSFVGFQIIKSVFFFCGSIVLFALDINFTDVGSMASLVVFSVVSGRRA